LQLRARGYGRVAFDRDHAGCLHQVGGFDLIAAKVQRHREQVIGDQVEHCADVRWLAGTLELPEQLLGVQACDNRPGSGPASHGDSRRRSQRVHGGRRRRRRPHADRQRPGRVEDAATASSDATRAGAV
jgi:hypothetical protein